MSLFAREPRIEAALLERRDDVREWAVYADWLEANGSPRGALASLMLRRETTPTVALAEALKAHSQLLAELTPEPLKTLGTRGFPRLAPVFRRGFIHSAGAADATDLAALVEHPSCALLDTALLEPGDADTLDAWLATVKTPLPWRRLELHLDPRQEGEALSLTRLFELTPRLEHLTLTGAPEALDLRGLPCTSVSLGGATPATLRALLAAKPKRLARLELERARNEWGQPQTGELDALVEALQPVWKTLDEVILEGAIGDVTRRACLAGARPRRVVVRCPTPSAEPFAVPLSGDEETSFVLFSRPLTGANEAALTAYAKLAGVSRLVLHVGALQLGQRAVTVVRLHGTGEAPLVARVVAQQLVKADRALDAVALTLSSSNDVTSAWSFGPHVAKTDARSNTIPLARREEGRFTRHQMVRELLDAFAGFDPGLDGLEVVLGALELPSDIRTLLGDAPGPGEAVPLFTDFPADAPREDEEDEELDEDEEYDEYEEQGGADRRDALAHQVGDDEPQTRWYDEDEEFGADQWGATPENVPDFGPRPAAPQPEVPVVIGASLAPTANAADDDPEDDLDERTHDAWSADEAEVWSEGPVDLPEHHRGPIGETFDELVEPADFPLGTSVPDAAPCAHCSQLRETARCAACRDEVCRECAGVTSLAAWDEGRDFSCAHCTPRSAGRFVAVRAR